MVIFKDDTIKDVQTRFTNLYPFLRIEFYKKAHALFAGSKATEQYNSDEKIIEINPEFKQVTIPLVDEMSVNALEVMLEDSCNLHAQVFRKSGSVWLQTSSTDDWSLSKHMEKAEDAEHLHSQR